MRLSPRVLGTSTLAALCSITFAGCGGGGDDEVDRKADDDGAGVVEAFAKAYLSCDEQQWKDGVVPYLDQETRDSFDLTAENLAVCRKADATVKEVKRDGFDDEGNPEWVISIGTPKGPDTDTVTTVQTSDGWAVHLD